MSPKQTSKETHLAWGHVVKCLSPAKKQEKEHLIWNFGTKSVIAKNLLPSMEVCAETEGEGSDNLNQR